MRQIRDVSYRKLINWALSGRQMQFADPDLRNCKNYIQISTLSLIIIQFRCKNIDGSKVPSEKVIDAWYFPDSSVR